MLLRGLRNIRRENTYDLSTTRSNTTAETGMTL